MHKETLQNSKVTGNAVLTPFLYKRIARMNIFLIIIIHP